LLDIVCPEGNSEMEMSTGFPLDPPVFDPAMPTNTLVRLLVPCPGTRGSLLRRGEYTGYMRRDSFVTVPEDGLGHFCLALHVSMQLGL
jgi:hypothetical protein